ncbi:MAG: ATP synthase F1 subunit delta [Firmicutes bacterium]|jgi:F-type H+-transporting ATPase subunit delta|nr:ATP synthase F1 subunit delta [Bacillota bacterium]MDH7495664.1 ATP synthase F1 subunit delta [Bacillota bacterium]
MMALDPGMLARALLSIARERLEPETVADELAEVTRILASVQPLRRTLADPGIPSEERRLIISDALGDLFSPVTLGLLDLLVDENQVDSLGAVARGYRRLLDEDKGVVRARVTSAIELTPDDVAALRKGLAERFGGRILLEQDVDPGILGGLIVQVGDTVIDGSVLGRLRRLRDELEAPHASGALRQTSRTATVRATGTSAGTSANARSEAEETASSHKSCDPPPQPGK